MCMVLYDCHTAIHLKQPYFFLGIAYSSRITLSLFTDLSLSTVPVNILSLYQLVLCSLDAIKDRRTRANWAIGGGNPVAK